MRARMMDALAMRAGCAGGRRTGVRARCAWWSGLGRCGAHGLCERDGRDEMRGMVTDRRTGALRVGCTALFCASVL